MTNYEAIMNLTSSQLERFLDQVYLTGLNTGYQSLVDKDINTDNPFCKVWLQENLNGPRSIVEDETGEAYIVDPLVIVVNHIIKFDTDSIPDDIKWCVQIVLPQDDENMR